MSGARMLTEVTSLLLAGIVVLSSMGVRMGGLILPAGLVLAIACRDLLQNLIAGACPLLAERAAAGLAGSMCSARQLAQLGQRTVSAVVTAGCYLVLVQPFRLGDKVAVGCSGLPAAAAVAAPTPAAAGPAGAMLGQAAALPASMHGGGGSSSSWFEGTVEKVDLRYTCLR